MKILFETIENVQTTTNGAWLSGVVGVNDVAKEIKINLYPNPSSGNVYYSFFEGVSPLKQINVYAIDGKLINTIFSNDSNGVFEIKDKGIYYIEFHTEGQVFTERVIIN